MFLLSVIFMHLADYDKVVGVVQPRKLGFAAVGGPCAEMYKGFERAADSVKSILGLIKRLTFGLCSSIRHVSPSLRDTFVC